jgi:hypothetical protein
MTVRDTRKKTVNRAPAERSLKTNRPAASRAGAGLRRRYDPSRQAEEILRTFSDRWEW